MKRGKFLIWLKWIKITGQELKRKREFFFRKNSRTSGDILSYSDTTYQRPSDPLLPTVPLTKTDLLGHATWTDWINHNPSASSKVFTDPQPVWSPPAKATFNDEQRLHYGNEEHGHRSIGRWEAAQAESGRNNTYPDVVVVLFLHH